MDALDKPQQAAKIHQGLTGRLFIISLSNFLITDQERSDFIKQHSHFECYIPVMIEMRFRFSFLCGRLK